MALKRAEHIGSQVPIYFHVVLTPVLIHYSLYR
jgi:hypothetical protein